MHKATKHVPLTHAGPLCNFLWTTRHRNALFTIVLCLYSNPPPPVTKQDPVSSLSFISS